MKIIRKILILFAVLLIIVFPIACENSDSEEKVVLTVSAAISLKDVMTEIKENYLMLKPDIKINLNLGSSGSLQQQVEQGADIDVFISADTSQMTALENKDLLIEESEKDLMGNKLVLITSNDSFLKEGTFYSVLDPSIEKLGVGEPLSVPAGKYAAEVFSSLDILESIKSKIVYAKDVREVLTWVETGNVEAGVVYKTDAIISSKAKIIATAPDDSHSPIIYSGAVIQSTKNTTESLDFMNFLNGEEAKSIYEKYGFNRL